MAFTSPPIVGLYPFLSMDPPRPKRFPPPAASPCPYPPGGVSLILMSPTKLTGHIELDGVFSAQTLSEVHSAGEVSAMVFGSWGEGEHGDMGGHLSGLSVGEGSPHPGESGGWTSLRV